MVNSVLFTIGTVLIGMKFSMTVIGNTMTAMRECQALASLKFVRRNLLETVLSCTIHASGSASETSSTSPADHRKDVERILSTTTSATAATTITATTSTAVTDGCSLRPSSSYRFNDNDDDPLPHRPPLHSRARSNTNGSMNGLPPVISNNNVVNSAASDAVVISGSGCAANYASNKSSEENQHCTDTGLSSIPPSKPTDSSNATAAAAVTITPNRTRSSSNISNEAGAGSSSAVGGSTAATLQLFNRLRSASIDSSVPGTSEISAKELQNLSPSNVSAQLWGSLREQYNVSQLKAIFSICTSCKQNIHAAANSSVSGAAGNNACHVHWELYASTLLHSFVYFNSLCILLSLLFFS